MSELLDLAERAAGRAGPGEQVEVFVGRSHHTDVKVFDGAVESLSSADTQGVGVRVISRGRQGFAYAASLESSVVAETLAEARDNAVYGTVDEFLGLASPDGVEPVDLDLFRPELASFGADRKVELALELEREVRAADPRIRGVESAEYGDSVSESAIASTEGVRATTGREGEAVAVPFLTLVDDPTEAQAWGAARYDAEGLASRRNVLIANGVLQGFLHNTYTGRRCGQPSNASAVRGGYRSTPGAGSRALTLAPGRRSQEELVADVGEGLLVQSVTGLHSGANPVSGDFSVGVDGMMVRDGATAEPVREATIASTIPRMLLDLVAVGSDQEWLPGGAAGMTLVIADVTLSGS
jgi:predicted Zn-dependent protease